MGNAKISMFVSLVMNVVNIVGNTICVYGLHMGVEGVAYPTLISRIVAAVMMFYLIQNPDNVVRIRRLSELKPDFKMIRIFWWLEFQTVWKTVCFSLVRLRFRACFRLLGLRQLQVMQWHQTW